MKQFSTQAMQLIGGHGHWLVWSDGNVAVKQPKQDYLLEKNLEMYNRVKRCSANTLPMLEHCTLDGQSALLTTLLTDYVSPNSVDPAPENTKALCLIEGKAAPLFCTLEQQFYKSKVGPILNANLFLGTAESDIRSLSDAGLEVFGDAYFFKVSTEPYHMDYTIADWDNIEYKPYINPEQLFEDNMKMFEQEYNSFKYLFC